MMLIDSTDEKQASDQAQAWSRHWDKFDPRCVTKVIKL
jgi:hypothetical protein